MTNLYEAAGLVLLAWHFHSDMPGGLLNLGHKWENTNLVKSSLSDQGFSDSFELIKPSPNLARLTQRN